MKEKCCKYRNFFLNKNKNFDSISFKLKFFDLFVFLLLNISILLLSDSFILLCDSQSIDSQQFSGGSINGHKVLSLKESPFYIKNDILVEEKSKLIIESGVSLFFNYGIGLTVKGTLIAKVFSIIFFLTLI
jgi:hypothetical protein